MNALEQNEPAPAKKRTAGREILSWVLTLALAAAIALPVRAFVFEPIRVDGHSMNDTLKDGELMIITKPEYLLGSPQRQDVVICRFPNRTEYFVKRLIGLPGDTVEIQYNRETGINTVYVNGQALDEPYLTSRRNRKNNAMAPLTLGADEYFVMGDNRDDSNDSRSVGPLGRSQIAGHARLVFYPLGGARMID